MKDTVEKTYFNFKSLVKDLEGFEKPGYQVLDIEGLAIAGNNGDRETFHIEGNKIVIPSIWLGAAPQYNNNASFGISLNSDGEDTDYWFNFFTAVNTNNYQQTEIKDVCFYKFTVRNLYTLGSPERIRLYIFQDPFFISQVNAILKGRKL